MEDKLTKVRGKIERLKAQLLRGSCSSQVAMETRCKEEAYDEVLAILDSMQEEPKECMYSKDNYTDEDRKALCDGCEEKCRFYKKEESINNGLDLGCGVIWKDEEPVSEDLEEAASRYAKEEYSRKNPATLPDRCIGCYAPIRYAFKAGANWQKEQIIKRLCNHANIDQMVEKFEDKYKPEKVLDTEYYKRGIFDTIKTIKED